jgi:DNA-binding MarR family transcriptional regulator
VNKLLKLGYVEKKSHLTDNRISLIALTRKGTALKTDFQLIAKKLRAKSYMGISDDEREMLVHLLKKLNNNI